MNIPEAELAVVGSMLLSPNVIDEVSDLIQGSDFHDPRLETIFDAILATRAAGHPVDALSVADTLTASKDLERVGGHAGLHALVGKVASPRSATYHAGRVREASILRNVAVVGVRLQALGEDPANGADSAVEVVNRARTELDRLVIDDRREVPHSVAVFQAIDALDEPAGTPTPWAPLTASIAGWKAGNLYIAAARPGKGKTVIVGQCALDVARRGLTAVVFSLEMTKVELYHRMLASVAEVDMGRIQSRTVNAQDRAKLTDAARHIASLPLVVSDRADMTVAQMSARVRAVRRDHPVGLVCVDYLGLARPSKSAGTDRRVQVDAIARDLKMLAKDLEVPVLAAAQLNRAVESRSTGMPVLSDLRESGGQEAAADVVMLLHRSDDEPGELVVSVAKNRHGPQSRFSLDFLGRFSRVDEPRGW